MQSPWELNLYGALPVHCFSSVCRDRFLKSSFQTNRFSQWEFRTFRFSVYHSFLCASKSQLQEPLQGSGKRFHHPSPELYLPLQEFQWQCFLLPPPWDWMESGGVSRYQVCSKVPFYCYGSYSI